MFGRISMNGWNSLATYNINENQSSEFKNTRGNMKCPKKHVKDVFYTSGHMHIYLKCPKIEDLHFLLIFHFQTSHVFFP